MTTKAVSLDAMEGQARAGLRLWGPDTVRFLHGTVSADIEGLLPERARPAALLTVKGKLVCEMLVLSDGPQQVRLLVPIEVADVLAEQLEKHIIMDEVEVERLGPISAALVFSDDEAIPDLGAEGVQTFETRHPAPGRLVIGDAASVAAAIASYEAVDAAGFDAYRVQTASPAWGHELAPDFFPPEVGFVYAVDYDKGCYMGQEPLARIHARGQVNRVMVRVQADRAAAVPVDLTHDERPAAGRWTTAVQGEGGQTIGLAIVRRSFAQPDTLLRTADDDPVEVRVVSGPLGDDPGMQGRNRAVATATVGGPR